MVLTLPRPQVNTPFEGRVALEAFLFAALFPACCTVSDTWRSHCELTERVGTFSARLLAGDEERRYFLDPGSSVLQAAFSYFTYVTSWSVRPCEDNTVITCDLKMRKLRPREVKQLSQSHTARRRASI